MKTSVHPLFRTLLIAGLFVLCVAVQAQEPAAPAPAAVEAPAQPAEPAAEPAAAAGTAEAPADETSDDPFEWVDEDGPESTSSTNKGVVAVGDDSTLGAGERANAVVSVFGSSTSEGTVDQAVVSVFGDARATGPVGNAVVAVLGDVYVNNRVGDAVVAVLGNVELGPQADVGEVVVIGGELTRDAKAIVRGGVQRILTSEFRGLRFLRPWTRHALLLGRPLALEPGLGWAWGFAFGFLALYVGFALLFKDGVDKCVETLETRPGNSVLAAILATVLTPVLMMVLLISVLGIAAIPFVMLALIGACLFGKAVVLAWIGKRCTRFFDAGPLAHTAFAVLIGGFIVMALYLVPVVGFVLFNALGVLGLGVVIYTLLLGVQSSRRERAASAEPAAPPGAATPGFADARPVDAGTATSGFADARPVDAGTATSGFADARPVDAGAATSGFADARPADAGTSASDSAAAQPGAAGAASADAPFSAGPSMASSSAPPPPPGSGSAGFTAAADPASAAAGRKSEAPAAGPAAQTLSDAATAALPRATFWMRMGALAIDAVMIGILVGMLNESHELWLLLLGAYGAAMWKLKGTTIGGIVFGLKVVRRDGRPIDWATAIVRALSCFLSAIVAGLGFLWIIFDHEKQAWHDKIAGTVVVTMPKGVSLL